MSFGLTNAPPTFQWLMHRVLHGLDWKICLVYIDDVILFSSTFEEHLLRLSAVFDCLRNANLKLKPSKCHFARSSVNFLGFVVSAEGILPDTSKIDAVKTCPTPRSVTEVRSFLGLCTYYRCFVRDFAQIASPLNRLTRKSVPFVWDKSCQGACQEMKNRLCSPPILAYPDFSQPFHLYTDASQHAIGYILGQFIDNKEIVILYGGRELNIAETRYSTTEHEALAVVDGIKRYQPYLYGGTFYVHSDHGSLSWLMKVKDPTGRLARWALQLQQYDFEIYIVQVGKMVLLMLFPDVIIHLLTLSLLLQLMPFNMIAHQLSHCTPCNDKILIYSISFHILKQQTYLHVMLKPDPYYCLLTRITLTKTDFCATFGLQGKERFHHSVPMLLFLHLFDMIFCPLVMMMPRLVTLAQLKRMKRFAIDIIGMVCSRILSTGVEPALIVPCESILEITIKLHYFLYQSMANSIDLLWTY